MNYDKLKEDLGEELCRYCPWTNNKEGIARDCDSLCEGDWCDDALENYLEENDVEMTLIG